MTQAEQILEQKGLIPAFFEKLAQYYNIVPQNEAEANAYLQLAQRLAMQNVTKQAQAQTTQSINPVLSAALNRLAPETAAYELAEQEDRYSKEAAHQELTGDEELLNAALAYSDQLAKAAG